MFDLLRHDSHAITLTLAGIADVRDVSRDLIVRMGPSRRAHPLRGTRLGSYSSHWIVADRVPQIGMASDSDRRNQLAPACRRARHSLPRRLRARLCRDNTIAHEHAAVLDDHGCDVRSARRMNQTEHRCYFRRHVRPASVDLRIRSARFAPE